MSFKSTHHCSFSGIVELMDEPRVLRGASVVIPATLQGPPFRTIPNLQVVGDIPLEIEFYNESDEVLSKGSVAVCFGCICFKDQSPAVPMLSVRASKLSPYVFSPIPVPYPAAYPDPTPSFRFLKLPGRPSARILRRHSTSNDECLPGFRRRCGPPATEAGRSSFRLCLDDGVRREDGGSFDLRNVQFLLRSAPRGPMEEGRTAGGPDRSGPRYFSIPPL